MQLLANINTPSVNLAELSAAIIARCCETPEQQAFFANAGAIPWLLQMLLGTHAKAQESALDALGAICRDNAALSKTLVSIPLPTPSNASPTDPAPKLASIMIRHLHDPRPNMRLIAATALANLFRSGAIPEHQSDITLHVLPALVKLFVESNAVIQEKSPLVLAYLVSESEDMQKAASESDAIAKLAIMLGAATSSSSDTPPSAHHNRLKESTLLAIAAVCSLKEECRKQVV